MSISDAQYAAWLVDPTAIRVTLVEVVVNSGGSEITRYLATEGYVTSATDTPANKSYSPIVSTGIKVTESIPIGGGAQLTAGDIEIWNEGGERDSWFSDIWANRPVKAYIGDVRWARSDFRVIFNGIVADIGSKSRDKINLALRDKLQQLNTPVSDAKLLGTTPNKDQVLPLVFGEVHNLSPLLTNPSTLEYQVHNGPVETIFEVRDNGVPVNVTTYNATGKFNLLANPAGAITVSVQGDKPAATYYNTVSQNVQRIVTGYGKVSQRFTSADLDTANLATFDAANQQPIGIYLDGRTNVLQAIQSLADSVGAQVIMSRTGLLRLIKIALPAVGTPTTIKLSAQMDRTLQIANRTNVVAAVKIGYCRNYTIQNGLVTSIPAQHKDLFETEWLTATQSDTAVQSTYKLDLEPVQQDTNLMVGTDAINEATRRLNLYKVTRTTYKFEGTAAMLLLELGQAVTLYSSRFGLSAGVLGMVTSLTPDWQTGHVTVEVLI